MMGRIQNAVEYSAMVKVKEFSTTKIARLVIKILGQSFFCIFFIFNREIKNKLVEASNVINDPKCNKGPKCNNFWP